DSGLWWRFEREARPVGRAPWSASALADLVTQPHDADVLGLPGAFPIPRSRQFDVGRRRLGRNAGTRRPRDAARVDHEVTARHQVVLAAAKQGFAAHLGRGLGRAFAVA